MKGQTVYAPEGGRITRYLRVKTRSRTAGIG